MNLYLIDFDEIPRQFLEEKGGSIVLDGATGRAAALVPVELDPNILLLAIEKRIDTNGAYSLSEDAACEIIAELVGEGT